MSKHKHKQDHHDRQHKNKHQGGSAGRPGDKKGLHKDWRTWGAVVLMLIAIVAYILSMDESILPSGGQNEAPAAEIAE